VTEVVLYREEGDLAYITLNRPEKLNALNLKVFQLLDEYVTRFEYESDAKVAIIHGNGRCFAAGADIEHYVGISSLEYAEFMRFGNGVQQKFVECPKPVIAAVHGFALGGGFELALACDFIVASTDAQFGLPEVKLGLLPGGGGTQRLPRFIGATRSAEVLMTAKRISGTEAVEWGLALSSGELPSALEAAELLAHRIANQAPIAVRMAKLLLRSGADTPLSTGLALEQAIGAAIYVSADATEGINAFVEKRTPKFIGK
jgi:enoyl-CoA hydratase/carnithine racemase